MKSQVQNMNNLTRLAGTLPLIKVRKNQEKNRTTVIFPPINRGEGKGTLGWGVFAFVIIFLFVPMFTEAAILNRAPNNLGLVGYWPMDEGSGSQAGDFSGRKNTGTLTNMEDADWFSGRFGKSLDMDGSNEYVKVLYNSALDLTDLTLSVWVKYTANNGGKGLVSRWATTDENYIFWCNSNHLAFGADISNETLWSNGCTTLQDNKWHHIVATRSGQIATIYADGIQKQQTDNAGNLTGTYSGTQDINIGAYQNGAFSSTFQGQIDDVRIYNRALTAAQVVALYQSGAVRQSASSADLDNGTTLENGLIGFWTLDGKDTIWSTNKTNDLSGSGNTGTITNMSTTTSPAIGKLGQALKFDGVDDYVSVGDTSALRIGSNSFSISVWAKPKTGNILQTFVGKLNASSPFPGYHFCIAADSNCNTSGTRLTFYYGTHFSSTQYRAYTTTSVNDGNWHNYVGVADKNQLKILLYMDGVEQATTLTQVGSWPNNTDTTALSIGKVLSTNYFNGPIDDVRIYNRALSASEIKQLYNLGGNKVNASQNTRLTNGLVGLWSFNGADVNWSTNKTNDLSGSGNTGTITNMSTTTSPAIGKLGQALKFDGVDDYVVVSDNSSLQLTTSFTIGLWVKSSSISQASKYFLSKNNNYAIIYEYTNDNIEFFANGYTGSDPRVGSSISLADTNWHYILYTYDGSIWSGYKDGVNIFSTNRTFSLATSASSLFIGSASGSVNFVAGNLDDVRIYNRALSADEVKQLYNLGR